MSIHIAGYDFPPVPKSMGSHLESRIWWPRSDERVAVWVLQRRGQRPAIDVYHYHYHPDGSIDLVGDWRQVDEFTAHCVVLHLLNPEGNDDQTAITP